MTRVALAPVSLIAMMMLVGLIVGLILLFIKGGKTTRIVIGCVLLVGLLLFLGLFGMRAVRVPRPQETAYHVSQRAISVPMAPAPAEDPGLWQANLEQELIPDVYSSKETAAFGLGMQLLETIQAASDPMPDKILILESGAGGDLALLEQFRSGLKTILNETPVAISKPTSESPDNSQLWIELSVQLSGKIHPVIAPGQSGGEAFIHMQKTAGKIQSTVQSINGKFIKEVKFDHRPWVFGQIQEAPHIPAWNPKVFRSFSTATAKQQAIEQAMGKVRQHLGYGQLSDNIQLDTLRRYGMLNDLYTQKLQGLSGPIWRAALLVDISDGRLSKLRHDQATLHQRAVAVQSQVRRSWIGLIGQFVGMIALICLIYIVINSMTKGYYSVKLGFIAVILVLILSGLILLMH